MTSSTILTRYLYNKDSVAYSLEYAIKNSETEEALFWAYELYRSGFQTELIQLLFSIYDNHYTQFSHLQKCLQKKYEKWKKDYKTYATFPATMVKNMILRNKMKTDNPKVLIIECKECDIAPFQTKDIPVGKPYKYLKMSCEFAVKSDKMPTENLFHRLESQTQWLYYASFSPLWNMRLQKYKATVNHLKKDVVFETDDELELFMDKFGFEPEEQILKIQQFCLGFHSSYLFLCK